MATVDAQKGDLFYAPKPVPPMLAPLIAACISGDLEAVKASWKPGVSDIVRRLTREDTGLPLLNAVHRLKVEVVDFLLQQGLSPRQRGTVHPYTGDSMTVAELQGITSLELIAKMLFMHPRKSKRRDAIIAVQELLKEADSKQMERLQSLQQQLSGSPCPDSSASPISSNHASAAAVFLSPAAPVPIREAADEAPATILVPHARAATPVEASASASTSAGDVSVSLIENTVPDTRDTASTPAVARVRKEANITPVPFSGLSSAANNVSTVKKARKQPTEDSVSSRKSPAYASSAFANISAPPNKRPRLDVVDATASVTASVTTSVVAPVSGTLADDDDEEGNAGAQESQPSLSIATDVSPSCLRVALSSDDAGERSFAADVLSAVESRMRSCLSASLAGVKHNWASVAIVGCDSASAPTAVAAVEIVAQSFDSLSSLINASSAAAAAGCLVSSLRVGITPEVHASPEELGYRYSYGDARLLAHSVLTSLSFDKVRSSGSVAGSFPHALPAFKQTTHGISPHLLQSDEPKHTESSSVSNNVHSLPKPSSIFSAQAPVAAVVYFAPTGMVVPSLQPFLHMTAALPVKFTQMKPVDIINASPSAKQVYEQFQTVDLAMKALVGNMVVGRNFSVVIVFQRPSVTHSNVSHSTVTAAAAESPVSDDSMRRQAAQELWCAALSTVLRSKQSKLYSANGQACTVGSIAVNVVKPSERTRSLLPVVAHDYVIATVQLSI